MSDQVRQGPQVIDYLHAGAQVSPDGRYRWTLDRRWAIGEAPLAVFIMLNPSTADATRDDPTIRRCVAFAAREGAGALRVVNLRAYRATNPRNVPAPSPDEVDENRTHITHAIAMARASDGPVIAAWGTHPIGAPHDEWVYRCALDQRVVLRSFGRTMAGHPPHPLYQRADAPLVPWAPAGFRKIGGQKEADGE